MAQVFSKFQDEVNRLKINSELVSQIYQILRDAGNWKEILLDPVKDLNQLVKLETIGQNLKDFVTVHNFKTLCKLERKVAKEMLKLDQDIHMTEVNRRRASNLHQILTVFIPMLRNITVEFVDDIDDFTKMIRLLPKSNNARVRISKIAVKVFGFAKMVEPAWRVYSQLTQINTVDALDNLLKDLTDLGQIDEQIHEKFGPEISQLVQEIQCKILAQQLLSSSQIVHAAVAQGAVTQEAVTQGAVTQEAVTQEAVTQEAVTQEAVTQEGVTPSQSSTSDLNSHQSPQSQVAKDQAKLAGASLPPHAMLEPRKPEKVRSSSGNQPYLDSALGSLCISQANSEPDFNNALLRSSLPRMSLIGQRLAHDSLDVSSASSAFDLNTSDQLNDNEDVFQE